MSSANTLPLQYSVNRTGTPGCVTRVPLQRRTQRCLVEWFEKWGLKSHFCTRWHLKNRRETTARVWLVILWSKWKCAQFHRLKLRTSHIYETLRNEVFFLTRSFSHPWRSTNMSRLFPVFLDWLWFIGTSWISIGVWKRSRWDNKYAFKVE